MQNNNHIGFIGLGSMGSAFVKRLLSQGYTVGVYNRTKAKAHALEKEGAWIANTPKELAEKVDIVMLCVMDDAAVRAVMNGKMGALAGAKKGQVFIDCSTVSVSVTREMDKGTKKRGAYWLDTPALGNPKMSEDGEQSFVVGGDAKALKKVRPVLESIGTKIVYMGKTGLGQASKIVHSLVCGVSLVAYSEAVLLGNKFGLTRKQTLEVLLNGAVASKLLTIKAPKLESNKFTPTAARLANMLKDISLANTEGKAFKQDLPTLSATKAMYDKANAMGLIDEDTSSVIKAVAGKK